MHSQPWTISGPQWHLPIHAYPCWTKVVNMHQESFSERVLHKEGTDGSLLSQKVLPRDLDRHSPFPQRVRIVPTWEGPSNEVWPEVTGVRSRHKQEQGLGLGRSEDTREATTKAPPTHNNLVAVGTVSVILFGSQKYNAQSRIWYKPIMTQRQRTDSDAKKGTKSFCQG